MSLLTLQAAFRAEIAAADDAALPSSRGPSSLGPSSLGMEIYRNAYRARLLSALEVSFERTRRWAGQDAFTAAGRHYVLTRPPRSWTLDDYGADFPDLLETLFPADPEVAELAAMEWSMQQAFAAPDAPTLDPAALAAAHDEADWDRMGFVMAAGYGQRPATHDLPAFWDALSGPDPIARGPVRLAEEAHLIVWRSGLSPRHRLADADEAQALDAIARGATLGDLAETPATPHLGAWLTRWFGEGIFAAGVLR